MYSCQFLEYAFMAMVGIQVLSVRANATESQIGCIGYDVSGVNLDGFDIVAVNLTGANSSTSSDTAIPVTTSQLQSDLSLTINCAGGALETRSGQRMAAKPLQHDAVRLFRCFLEDGVAATGQHDEFGSA